MRPSFALAEFLSDGPDFGRFIEHAALLPRADR
jgi:hypothetical protein